MAMRTEAPPAISVSSACSRNRQAPLCRILPAGESEVVRVFPCKKCFFIFFSIDKLQEKKYNTCRWAKAFILLRSFSPQWDERLFFFISRNKIDGKGNGVFGRGYSLPTDAICRIFAVSLPYLCCMARHRLVAVNPSGIRRETDRRIYYVFSYGLLRRRRIS